MWFTGCTKNFWVWLTNQTFWVHSLPETSSMPCAQTRAHGKSALCRVPVDRAHGKLLAHGKRDVCRVPKQKTHGKDSAHGKEALFGVCLTFNTRQRSTI